MIRFVHGLHVPVFVAVNGLRVILNRILLISQHSHTNSQKSQLNSSPFTFITPQHPWTA